MVGSIHVNYSIVLTHKLIFRQIKSQYIVCRLATYAIYGIVLFWQMSLCVGCIRFIKIVISSVMLMLLLNTWSSQAYADEMYYSIHLSSCKDINNAGREVLELKDAGYDAFYKYESVKGKGKWYRIYVGKYSSKNEAEKEAETLKKLNLISYFAIRTVSEVTAHGTPYGADITEGYYLHVSSFVQKLNAEREVQRLEKHGYKCFSEPEDISGKTWLRVYIGAFLHEEDARKEGAELKENNIISFFKPRKISPEFSAGTTKPTVPSKKWEFEIEEYLTAKDEVIKAQIVDHWMLQDEIDSEEEKTVPFDDHPGEIPKDFDDDGTVQERLIEFGGYVEDTISVEYLRAEEKYAFVNSARIRNNFFKDFDGKYDFGIAVVGNIINGDTEFNISDYFPGKVTSQLPAGIRQSMQYEFENDIWLQEAYGSLYLGELKIRLGRQKYYTGTGYAWNPTDLFNRKNVLDPTYETEGIDGVFLGYSFLGDNEINLFYSIGTSHIREDRDFSSIEDGDFQIKATTHLDIWEIAAHYTEAKLDRTDLAGVLMGAIDPGKSTMLVKWRLAGAEASGELMGIGLRAEVGYAWLELYNDPYIGSRAGFVGDIKDHARFLIGVDYTFKDGLYLIGEYFYEGLGKVSADDYSLNERLSLFIGERYAIGRDNLFLGGSYPLSDLITMEFYTIANLDDPSVILNPWLVWIAHDDVTVSISGQIPFGVEDSSLGETGHFVFSRLKWTF